jgi:hypothetical protein
MTDILTILGSHALRFSSQTLVHAFLPATARV